MDLSLVLPGHGRPITDHVRADRRALPHARPARREDPRPDRRAAAHRARDRAGAVGQRGRHPGLPDALGGARPRRPAAATTGASSKTSSDGRRALRRLERVAQPIARRRPARSAACRSPSGGRRDPRSSRARQPCSSRHVREHLPRRRAATRAGHDALSGSATRQQHRRTVPPPSDSGLNVRVLGRLVGRPRSRAAHRELADDGLVLGAAADAVELVPHRTRRCRSRPPRARRRRPAAGDHALAAHSRRARPARRRSRGRPASVLGSCGEPGVEDLAEQRLRGRAQAEREHVGVVPAARARRGGRVAAHSAARTPATLLAAIDAPVPVQQHTIALLGAALGDVARGRLRSPRPVVALALAERAVGSASWPRRSSAPPPSSRGRSPVSSSAASEIRMRRESGPCSRRGAAWHARARRAAQRAPGTGGAAGRPRRARRGTRPPARCPGARRPGGRRPRRGSRRPAPCSAIHGARMKIAAHRRRRRTRERRTSASKLRIWRPNALRSRAHVHHAEVVAVEHDQPGARAEHRRARRGELAQRLGEPLALDAERHRRRLPARHHQPVEPVEVARHAHLARVARRAPRSIRSCASNPPCSASTPISGTNSQLMRSGA